VKFLLLERQRIALADVPGLLAGIPVVRSAMGQMDVAALAQDQALAERVGGGSAHPTSQGMPDGPVDAQTRRMGGSPAHASNADGPVDAAMTQAQTRKVGGFPAHASSAHSHAGQAIDPAYTTLANWAIASLIRAQAARLDGNFLIDQ